MGEINVELLDTDVTGCSVTGNNYGGERSIFDQMNTTLLPFI